MTRTGLDRLIEDGLEELKGKRIGLLCNSASITHDGVHAIEALCSAGARITALFSPEHGLAGDVAAGKHVDNSFDEKSQCPVFSLYGKNRSPSKESLDLIDLMLIDIQEVGSRFYTYIWTTARVIIECGRHAIPVIVLDRPNPVSGFCVEGPILEADQASFVGMYPIPIRHGLTIGELAKFFTEKLGIVCQLDVVPMQGWQRSMYFEETGLPWVRPSPNIVRPDTALYYPGTCLFEGTNISEGRGSDSPFQIIGAPWLEHEKLRDALQDRGMPGVQFETADFVAAKYPDEKSNAIRVFITDRCKYQPVHIGLSIIVEIRKFHPNEFEFQKPFEDGRRFFDLLAGNRRIREDIEMGKSADEIEESWRSDLLEYENYKEDILIY